LFSNNPIITLYSIYYQTLRNNW